MWHICYNWWTNIDTILLTKFRSSYLGSLFNVHSVNFDKYIMSRIHHHCIITQNNFTILEASCFHLVVRSFSPWALDNHWHFYCLSSFAFPRMSPGWSHILYFAVYNVHPCFWPKLSVFYFFIFKYLFYVL